MCFWCVMLMRKAVVEFTLTSSFFIYFHSSNLCFFLFKTIISFRRRTIQVKTLERVLVAMVDQQRFQEWVCHQVSLLIICLGYAVDPLLLCIKVVIASIAGWNLTINYLMTQFSFSLSPRKASSVERKVK